MQRQERERERERERESSAMDGMEVVSCANEEGASGDGNGMRWWVIGGVIVGFCVEERVDWR